MAKKKETLKLAAENRRARYEYHIEDTFEAGIMLQGSEVKSLRAGQGNIAESYASAEGNELWLVNAYIPEYEKAARFGHEERRPRKLLLHRREIDRLSNAVQRQGMTLIPLKMYFTPKGIAKLEIGLAKGKKLHDKRQTERERDWGRDKQRLLKRSVE